MSTQTTRAKFIRSEMMTAALYGKAKGDIIYKSDLERFSIIYNFVDFIAPAHGNLRAHPVTGEDPQSYLKTYPDAAAAYRAAVAKWAAFRKRVRDEYLNK